VTLWHCWCHIRLGGWARFNVPLNTAWVISETMFLQVRWPNQQCQSTEGGWLVIQIALNLTRLILPCYNNTTCMHIQDTQRNLSTVSEPSEMKQNLVDEISGSATILRAGVQILLRAKRAENVLGLYPHICHSRGVQKLLCFKFWPQNPKQSQNTQLYLVDG